MLLLLCCAQLCLTFCNAMDCSLPGSSVHGMLQAKILEWVAISSSRGSSSLRDRTCIFCVSCTGRWILYHCATREALDMLNEKKIDKEKDQRRAVSSQFILGLNGQTLAFLSFFRASMPAMGALPQTGYFQGSLIMAPL